MSPKKILIVDDEADLVVHHRFPSNWRGSRSGRVQRRKKDEPSPQRETRFNPPGPDAAEGWTAKEICRLLKFDDRTAYPIFMLTAKTQEKGKILKETGADDYLTKPF